MSFVCVHSMKIFQSEVYSHKVCFKTTACYNFHAAIDGSDDLRLGGFEILSDVTFLLLPLNIKHCVPSKL